MHARNIFQTAAIPVALALAAFWWAPAMDASTIQVSLSQTQFSVANDGPFYLDFTLTGTAGNSVSLSNFNFGNGGSPVANTQVPTNGASGSLSTAILLNDTSQFYNDFFQQYTPGSQLGFTINMTNKNSSTPDTLTFSLLDFTQLPVPTLDPSGANTVFTINIQTTPQISAYAVDTSQDTGDTTYPALPAPTLTQVATPEGPTWLYGVFGLSAVLLGTRLRRCAWAAAAVCFVACFGAVRPASAQTCTLLSAPSGSPYDVAPGHEGTAIALADFDGDGIPDMAVATTAENTNAVLAVWKGNGAGGFSAFAGSPFPLSTTLMNNGDAASLVAADFNRDGKMDLIITSQTGAVAVITGFGNGQFSIPTAPLATFAYNPSIEPIAEVADLNGDGYPDAVISTSNTIILLNSAGTLSATSTVPTEHNGAWLGDVNGDGYPDLIGSTGKVYLNDTRGGFTTVATTLSFPVFSGQPSVAVGDFTGDGKVDILFTSETAGGTSVQFQVFAGDGSGSHFTAGTLVQTGYTFASNGSRYYNVVTGDFNGDGLLDFAFTEKGTSGTASTALYVYVGTGAGAFAVASGSPFPTGSLSATIFLQTASADLNLDGRPDLAVAMKDPNATNALAYVVTTNAKHLSLGVTTSANPAITGSALTLTAVIGGAPSCASPTGRVSFAVDNGPKSYGTVSNGQASVIMSGLTAGVHTITAAYEGDSNFQPLITQYVQLVGGSNCSANLTSQLTVKPGGFVYDRTHQQFVQTVTLTNNGPTITGPVSYALDSLSANASLVSPSGYTSCATPANSPLADTGICPNSPLAMGGSVTFFVRFTDPTMASISYTPRVLAGLAPR